MQDNFKNTCHEVLKKSKEFITRADMFAKTCKTKYTGECDIQVDKDILLADDLMEYAEMLSDILTEHLKKCNMRECVDASRNCSLACQDTMNSINDYISYCKDEQSGCDDRYQLVKKNCENLVHKVQVCMSKFCDMK